MLDMNFIRTNPELVKENIRKKFQDAKLPMVDELLELDREYRSIKTLDDTLRGQRNSLSKQIGVLMGQKKRDEAEEIKAQVRSIGDQLVENEKKEDELFRKIRKIQMRIPNMIADDVPIGKDDSFNVEEQRFGEPKVPAFEIPYHSDIMATFNGLDKDAAGRVTGNGFYYLMGDIARLHSAVLAYARDFMIDKGFIYCIPPFMIRSAAVDGVMSFAEKENMMYKIEGEDLYLIGTSEHSMIAKFKDQILKEKGVYRIHQFEKQEMIVVCKPEESEAWYDKMWSYSVELFRSMDIPVRKLVCCSGDLADLKYRSCDIEAWSPRQQKYFEVCSCSNLTDAQARRLGIRVQGEDGNKYFAHTLNNTVVAPPRMLIAFLENNLNEDGSVNIPEVLQPYMGGKKVLIPNK